MELEYHLLVSHTAYTNQTINKKKSIYSIRPNNIIDTYWINLTRCILHEMVNICGFVAQLITFWRFSLPLSLPPPSWYSLKVCQIIEYFNFEIRSCAKVPQLFVLLAITITNCNKIFKLEYKKSRLTSKLGWWRNRQCTLSWKVLVNCS